MQGHLCLRYGRAGNTGGAEEKAAERIFGLLPDDQRDELRGLFEEFEANETPEARFAHVMDNFQPLLLNNANDGGDWRAHRVSRSQVWETGENGIGFGGNLGIYPWID